MALGFKQAKYKNLGYVEFDKWAVETLRNNFSKNVNVLDITKIKNFSDELGVTQEVDVISGGFPCQSFSYAGLRKGIDDVRGTLFYDFARAVKEFMPKIVMAENVQGLIRHDGGKTLELILKTFSNLGYEMKYELINSNDYGVAQKRKRIIIIGVRKDIFKERGEFVFPKAHEYKPILKDILQNVPESEGAAYSEYKKSVMELVPPGGCWRDLPEDIAKEYMKGSYYLGGGRTGMARRLSFEEPSLTLTTAPAQNQTERCHPVETRPLNVREYARIQSFPDDFEFSGSINNQYKQIGNAVPVLVAKEFAEQIRKYLK